MSSPALYESSISSLGAALRSRQLTSVELTSAALERVRRYDSDISAFITVTAERAMADARAADAAFDSGIDRGPLQGIPYGLKDIFATAGVATTCNSRLRVDHVPRKDAAIESALRAGGAVLLGKLNTHEFALGGPSYDLPFPPARNPWNYAHFTGGSSSGCGAAVAAGFLRLAFGSDTGGSIRSPAGHCGVVGLKPTYGRVSRRGAFPLSYSLDHCGMLSSSVEDAALALGVVAGYDCCDPSSADVPVPDFCADIGRDLHGLRIGYARKFFATLEGLSGEVLGTLDSAAQTLASLGATVEDIALPDFSQFKACARIIMLAEAYAIHEADLQTRPKDFGRYTFQRIAGAAALTAADLLQAMRLRRVLTVDFNTRVLDRYHAVITATNLTPAPPLAVFPEQWPPPGPAMGALTAPFNVTGNPVLNVPAGFSAARLPIGMQIVGRLFDETQLFRIGHAYEKAASFSTMRPSLDRCA